MDLVNPASILGRTLTNRNRKEINGNLEKQKLDQKDPTKPTTTHRILLLNFCYVQNVLENVLKSSP